MPYFDAVKDLLAKYDTLAFDPKKGDALLAGKGFKKDGGIWTDAQGKKLTLDIIGFGAAGPAIGPVLSEMLKRRGVEARMSLPPDFDDRFQKGQFVGSIYGHGGCDQRALFDAAAVPGRERRGARRASGELRALEERRVRQDRRRDVRHRSEQQAEDDGAVPSRDGDLAAGAAGHPAGAELSTASR